MEISRLGRYAVGSCAATAMLAGCGTSQPPIGAPGAMPQASAVAAHADRAKSWVLVEAKSQNLLYVSSHGGPDEVLILSLKGKHAGKIGGWPSGYLPSGLCSDSSGNVYVVVAAPGSENSYIYEYAHAGTQPINTLADSGLAIGCAVDPTTGNLAVTNQSAPGSQAGNIAIYPDAQGMPTTYADSKLLGYWWCTYDADGDLFADGYNLDTLDELPAGSSQLSEIALSQSIYPGSIQSTSSGLVIASAGKSYNGAQEIYNVAVSGNTGTVTGPVTLDTKKDMHSRWLQFVNFGSTIMGPDGAGDASHLGFWAYPQGGEPSKVVIPGHQGFTIFGVTVSVAAGN